MLVSENHGDLLLTQEFRSYVSYRGFSLHFCRKSDPQSKGKVENVIRYIKYNFLRCCNKEGSTGGVGTGKSLFKAIRRDISS